MKLRTSYFVAVAMAETAALLVMWQAFRDATHGLQHMANVYADHRCADVVVTAEIGPVPSLPVLDVYRYVPGAPLVQPVPMTDPALEAPWGDRSE